MKRLLLVVVLGALAAAASGCDVSPPAATVNGASISQSTLNAQLTNEIGNSNTQCAVQLQSGLTTSPVGIGTEGDGTTPNAVTSSFAAEQLFTLVLQKLEEQALARRGVGVTSADVSEATTDYESQLQTTQSQTQAPAGCTLTTSSALAKQLPSSFVKREGASLADEEIYESAVGHVDLSDAALRSYYAKNRSEVTQECLNVIVADTAAAAQTVHDEIAGGTSFAAAGTTAGVDPGSPAGGELACEYPAAVAQQLPSVSATIAALATGQLAPPLTLQQTGSTGTTSTFYLVVQMRARQLVPFAQLRTSIREAILEQHTSSLGALLSKLVATAHVTVDPRYGTWNPKRGVTVSTPPPAAFVPNAAANVPVKPILSTGGITINPAPSS